MALGDRTDWPAAAQREQASTRAGLTPPQWRVKAPYPREKSPSRRGAPAGPRENSRLGGGGPRGRPGAAWSARPRRRACLAHPRARHRPRTATGRVCGGGRRPESGLRSGGAAAGIPGQRPPRGRVVGGETCAQRHPVPAPPQDPRAPNPAHGSPRAQGSPRPGSPNPPQDSRGAPRRLGSPRPDPRPGVTLRQTHVPAFPPRATPS